MESNFGRTNYFWTKWSSQTRFVVVVLTNFAVGTVGVVAAGRKRRRVAIGKGSSAGRVVALAAAGRPHRRVGVLECGRRRERVERRVSRRGDPRARVVVARPFARGGLLAARWRRGARLRLDHHPLVVAAVDAEQALGEALGGERHRAAAAAAPAEHHRGGARRLVLQVHHRVRDAYGGRVRVPRLS